jgi:hypothetical protein
MRRKLLLQLPLIAVLVSALGAGTLHQAKASSMNVASSPAQVLGACIPTQQVAKTKLVSSVRKGGNTYYLLAAYQQGDPVSTDLLISVNQQGRCSLLLYNPMGDVIPLSRFTPIDVAQLLALQRLKSEVGKAGGRAAYQQGLNEAASNGPSAWAPEEVWALKKLEIRLPSRFKIVDPRDIKVSPPHKQ